MYNNENLDNINGGEMIYMNRKAKYEQLLLGDETKVFGEEYKEISNILEDVYMKSDISSHEDDVLANNKKVLVIFYVHNNEFVEKDINSIFTQTHTNIVLLTILDNCNEVISNRVMQYRQFTKNNMIVFRTKNNNKGKIGAINQAFDLIIEADYNYDYALIMIKAELDREAIRNGVRFLASNFEYGAVFSDTQIMKTEKRRLLWHLQNIEFSTKETRNKVNGIIENKIFSLYKRDVINDMYNEKGHLFDTKSYSYETILEIKKLKYKAKISNSIKTYLKPELSLKSLFMRKIVMLKESISVLNKKGFTKQTIGDISNHILFVLMFILQIFLLISASFIGKIPLLFAISIILILSFIDSVLNIRRIIHKNKITYLLMLTPIPILYSWFNVFALISGYLYSLREIVDNEIEKEG